MIYYNIKIYSFQQLLLHCKHLEMKISFDSLIHNSTLIKKWLREQIRLNNLLFIENLVDVLLLYLDQMFTWIAIDQILETKVRRYVT